MQLLEALYRPMCCLGSVADEKRVPKATASLGGSARTARQTRSARQSTREAANHAVRALNALHGCDHVHAGEVSDAQSAVHRRLLTQP